MKFYFRLPFYVLIIGAGMALGQASSGNILHHLHKMQNPTRVLYLAAHPDDENTRMIAWLVNDFGAHTAYLSLTRGDGGQNLIGTELGAKLGVLRTQELMQARAIDGGHQFFSRAVDFGYSKTATETLKKWDRDKILSDVVWVIRKFRPDVVLTRFPPDGRGGHGHHTASAMLALEAYEKAADPNAFTEQLDKVSLWQPHRVYWNSSVWWNRKLDSVARNNPLYVTQQVGEYNPFLGASYNEIAAASRTSHKSQGFGVSVRRGKQTEYFKYLAGDTANTGLFEDIVSFWARYNFVEGDKILEEIIAGFNPERPFQAVPKLLLLREKSQKINDAQQRKHFQEQVDKAVEMCLGLHLEVNAQKSYFTPGDSVQLSMELIAYADNLQLDSFQLAHQNQSLSYDVKVESGVLLNKKMETTAPAAVSQPYWLEQPYEAVFAVSEQSKIGRPENKPAMEAHVWLSYVGTKLQYTVPVRYKYSDRVDGEIYKPVFVVPDLVANLSLRNLIFIGEEAQEVQVEMKNYSGKAQQVKVEAPGWEVSPQNITVPAGKRGSEKKYTIEVSPKKKGNQGKLSLSANGKALRQMSIIDYPHIDRRLVFEPAAVKLVAVPLAKKGTKVAYIMGAGDDVPQAIRQMGYQVDMLSEATFAEADLNAYQAVVAGIRAYNTEKWLPGHKKKLMAYIAQGGNYIVQYNTRSSDLLSQDLGPYPFTLSRNRVTEEDAPAKRLMPEHAVFQEPNALTAADFKGWVQERGLYFAGEWDEQYQTPLAWRDTGEEEDLAGGLLIGNHGKGAFIYTGISFFRQFPAGVPGAYRLLANLISYQHGGE